MRIIRSILLSVFVLLASIGIAQTTPDIPTVDVDHSYGTECGFTHIVPAYRDSIEGIIKRKKFEDMDRWLLSDEDIKTVYAIEAFYRLKDEHKISDEQLQIIVHYKENDVSITCCGRGIPEECSSKEVLASFEF